MKGVSTIKEVISIKTCSKCKIEKDESEFRINRNQCKACEKVYRKEAKTKPKVLIPDGFKVCSICKVMKNKNEFYSDRSHANLISSDCKECRKKKSVKTREGKKEYMKNYLKEYYKNNKTKMNKQTKENYVNNKEKYLRQQKEYAIKNKTEISKRQREYREKNHTTITENKAKYYIQNKDKIIQKTKIWRKTPEGRQRFKNTNDRRKRELGWTPINQYFEGSNGHHLRYTNDIHSKNNDIGLYVPKELHQSISHNGVTGHNMALANKKFLEWYLNTTPANERNKQAIKLYWNYCTLPEPVWIKEGITSEITKL